MRPTDQGCDAIDVLWKGMLARDEISERSPDAFVHCHDRLHLHQGLDRNNGLRRPRTQIKVSIVYRERRSAFNAGQPAWTIKRMAGMVRAHPLRLARPA